MVDSPGVTLAVTWMARPGHEGEVKDILMRLAEESRREPGCRQYIVHQSAGDPAHFFLYEQYASPKALKEHTESRHFKHFVLELAIPLLVSRQRLELRVL
jgi:autoinducer 2-degrading protein